jgi:hypothetical protein
MDSSSSKALLLPICTHALLIASTAVLAWGWSDTATWPWTTALGVALALPAIALAGRYHPFRRLLQLHSRALLEGNEAAESLGRAARAVDSAVLFLNWWMVLASSVGAFFVTTSVLAGRLIICFPIVLFWAGMLALVWNWYKTTSVLLNELKLQTTKKAKGSEAGLGGTP